MPKLQVQDIAIIGAGPCGLAAAKFLIAEKCFTTINIYEQSSQVGGVWNYTGDVRSTRASGIETGDEETFRVPQVDAHVGLEQPIWKRKKKKKKKRETRKFWEIGSGERDVDEHEMAKVALSPATSSRSNSSTQSSASSQSKQAIRETVEIPIDTSSESAVEEPRKTDMEPIFPSPMYEELETNIPRTLMCFSDLAFPSDCQLFPRHQAVKEYIDEYAKELLPLIKFETQVQDVRLLEAGRNASSDTGSETSEIIREKWLMKTKELRTGRIRERTYDAVVMANGHYSVPHVPEIEGAREWNEMFPGSMMHSRSFRTAEEFRDKKVIVIGNSASGLDIGRQISKVCKPPLLISQRSPSEMGSIPSRSTQIDTVPPILRFIPGENNNNNNNRRSVLFANGRLESHIDAILFCTGYLYSYPMLSSLKQAPPITDGARVEHTYEHLIYAPHPSLTFIALPQKVIPFPVSEAQAAVVARLYAGRLAVPSQRVMEEWEQDTLRRKGGVGRRFHVLSFPEDGEYINRLLDWARKADEDDEDAYGGGGGGGDGGGTTRARCSLSEEEEEEESITKNMENGKAVNKVVGKTRPKWGKREFWVRERFTDIRKAFLARGEERHGVRTLEELGFKFEHGG